MSGRKMIAVVDRNPIFSERVTVQFGYVEDGEFVLDHCDHSGAEEEQVDFGRGPDTDLRLVMVCDKCQEILENLS